MKATGESHIKWVKRRWRALLKLQKYKRDFDIEDLAVDPAHCSDYLDLFVLSEDVELKMKSICLTNKFPFILEPNSSFHIAWDYLSLISILIQCTMIPYSISFLRRIPSAVRVLGIFCDTIYLIDFLILMTTAVKDKNKFISSWSSIVLHKGKNFYFLIDCATIVYIDYIVWLIYINNVNQQLIAWLRINRILKIYKVLQFFFHLETNLYVNSLHASAAKYFFIYFMSTYISTCILHSVACFFKQCYVYGWFHRSRYLIQKRFPNSLNYHIRILVQAIYTASSIHLGFNISDHYAYTIHELIIFHLLMTSGTFLYLIYCSELCSSYMLTVEQKCLHILRLKTMKRTVTFKKYLSNSLLRQCVGFVNFQWKLNKNVEVKTERAILKQASADIYEGIIEDRILRTLKLVPLFRDYPKEILHRIASCSIFRTVPPGAFLMCADNKTAWIHVIVRGFCSCRSTMKGDKHRKNETVLSRGDAFPVVEVVHNVQTFLTVQAITAVELICVPYYQFTLIMKADKTYINELQATVEAHRQEDENLLLRKEGRLPPMIPEEKSLGQGDYFTYTIYDDYQEMGKEYLQPFFIECGKLLAVCCCFAGALN